MFVVGVDCVGWRWDAWFGEGWNWFEEGNGAVALRDWPILHAFEFEEPSSANLPVEEDCEVDG